ncbi:hemolysin III family protein [Aliiglaciecola sp. CAU 1673]|uniref:PAQR family membrane homeostasis protein TrhA n=1 Tax=Aliiglaciecola sp. CAU 1673 TaxID=3032595 RepID=UPI0023DBDE75|nr:hemolysin III family protein [Aliiglaciecola sp. CAU 1673]MDF2178589.1 hemolysin III family protein [Aliiglaciecola sp. CAU 1673]
MATSIPGFSDPFSSISHLLAALLVLHFGMALFRQAQGKQVRVVTVSIYVFTVFFLLSMSGVFHLLDPGTTGREVLKRLDHAGIFLLIAGTFTPIHAIMFRGFWRWGFLTLIWALAITGVVLKTIYFNALSEWLGLIFYIGLGWMGILSACLIHRMYGCEIIKPLLFGAIAYTLGALLDFLRVPVLIPGVLGPHELFHIAVLAGIAWHWKLVNTLLRWPENKGPVQR